MLPFLPLLAGVLASLGAAYFRASLRIWSIVALAAIVGVGALAGASWLAIAVPVVLLALVAVPLNLVAFRREKITAPLLAAFQKALPTLSDTEQVALDAGTVGFEGELFSGKPDWAKLLKLPRPALSADEQARLADVLDVLDHLCEQDPA